MSSRDTDSRRRHGFAITGEGTNDDDVDDGRHRAHTHPGVAAPVAVTVAVTVAVAV